MPRWKPDGLERLEAAAFDLFDEQGFDRTTVAEIARRAGLTQRTFYNHFTDKREVLFSLSTEFQQQIVSEIGDRADQAHPLDAVVGALEAAADTMFEGRRAVARRRHAIVDANPELRERDFSKRAALTDAIAAALHERGLALETAHITAGVAVLVQQTAIERWALPGEDRPLRDLLAAALLSVRATVC